jgi:regulatory protein
MKTGLARALSYSYLLLKFRARSEGEIRLRLEEKGFPAPVIGQALVSLKERHLIDDRSFAREWLNWRRRKNFPAERIEEELRDKGIAGKIITEVMQGRRSC